MKGKMSIPSRIGRFPNLRSLLLAAAVGCAGYYLGLTREQRESYRPAAARTRLDDFVSAESFSEVEQARAVLEALASQYIKRAQTLIVQELGGRGAASGDPAARAGRPILGAIEMLEEAMVEFKGTGHEFELVKILLFALKREQLYDRWLDVYLETLYEHPTAPILGLMADDAVLVSRAVEREGEVAAGLRYVNDLPLDFLAKSRIHRSLVEVISHGHERNFCTPQS